MQELFYKTKKKQGAYIIFSLYLIIALLSVVGLALDFANLYLKKLELQKGLQSAVYAALEARLSNDVVCDNGVGATPRWVEAYPLNGPRDEACFNTVELNLSQTIKSFLRLNLNTRDFDHLYFKNALVKEGSTKLEVYEPYKLNPDKSKKVANGNFIPQDVVSISMSLEVKTLLIDSIPFDLFGGIRNSFGNIVVSASATGQINPANIILVLDTSGSMACPSTATNCILDNTLTMICNGVVCDSNNIAPNAKIRDLAAGVTAFLRKFRSGKDNIKVVPFQLFSTVLDENSSNITSLIERIQTLPASGLTNTSDAIATAIEVSLGNTFRLPTETQLIIFSDGPPTAARFLMPVGPTTAGVPDGIKGFSQWQAQKDPPNTKIISPYNLTNFEEKPAESGTHVLYNSVVSSPWELGKFYNRSVSNTPPETVNIVDITSYKLAVSGGIKPTYFPGPLMYTPPLFVVEASPNSSGTGKFDTARRLNGTTWGWSNPTELGSISAYIPFCSYVFPKDFHPTNTNKSCHDNNKWNAAYALGNANCPDDESNKLRYLQDTRIRCIHGENTAPNSLFCASKPQDTTATEAYLSDRVLSALAATPDKVNPAFMQNCFNGLDFEYYNPSKIDYAAPNFNSASLTAAINSTPPNTLTIQQLSNKYYNTTIMFADQARKLGATVHTIGLGDSTYNGCPPGTTLSEPYQDSMDDFQRKDIFLSRIANASSLYVINVKNDGGIEWKPACNTIKSNNWESDVLSSPTGIKAGYSIATKDPRALTPVFLQLARKILLSLIPQPTAD